MRVIGIETEYALGFSPVRPGAPVPSQKALFQAVVKALKSRYRSCEALYYKGGDFLHDGSLIHFEVSRLDAPEVGLLEWATPECLGALEATIYSKAQEGALREAVGDAEVALREHGFEGRVFLLKNNEDRSGNAYGCHESYDVRERSLSRRARLVASILHPLVLLALLALAAVMSLPLLVLFTALGVAFAVVHLLAAFPLLHIPFTYLENRLGDLGEYLVEVGPTPGSGLVAHVALAYLRVGGVLFSLTGRRVLFTGHVPQLLPFLVTRPLLAGAGYLDVEGQYHLTSRPGTTRRVITAFIYGPARPLVDIKEFFYRKPLSYRAARKRLQLLSGNANRSEYTELLKLATTEVVMDAIEAGALDAVADRIELRGGPLSAYRLAAADPSLKAVVARDRSSGEHLTALDVQRRYLEAVWAHFSAQPEVHPEAKDALVRWNFVLDRLADDVFTLDRELDWVIKLRLLQATLAECLPGDPSQGWERLRAWGAVNRLVEARAPHIEFPSDPPPSGGWTPERVKAAVRAGVGWRRFRAADRAVRTGQLDWGDFPATREAFLRLKTLDLRYHELSTEGGYFDWLAAEGRVARLLDPARVERARSEPPLRTRATIRGHAVREHAESDQRTVRVGWEKIEVSEGEDLEPRQIRLDDPYTFELGEEL